MSPDLFMPSWTLVPRILLALLTVSCAAGTLVAMKGWDCDTFARVHRVGLWASIVVLVMLPVYVTLVLLAVTLLAGQVWDWLE